MHVLNPEDLNDSTLQSVWTLQRSKIRDIGLYTAIRMDFVEVKIRDNGLHPAIRMDFVEFLESLR